MNTTRAIVAGLVLTTSLCVLDGIQAGVPKREKALAKQTSTEIERGQSIQTQMLAKFERIEGTPFNQVMDRVFSRLVSTPEVAARSFPYEIALVKNDEANAFCVPGGKVFVYSGITSLVGDDENLWAALLGHELAHAVRSHSVSQEKGASRVQGTSRFLQKLGNIASRLPGGAAIGSAASHLERAGQIGKGLAFLSPFLMQKFSRSDEADADAQGMLYMAKAGFDPSAAIRFHQEMMARFGDAKAFTTFLRSHPRESIRVEKLEALLPSVRAMASAAGSDRPQEITLARVDSGDDARDNEQD